jgi:hypothetical protein
MVCRVTGVQLFYPAVMHHFEHHHHLPEGTSIPVPRNGMPVQNSPVCNSYQYNDLYHFANHGTDIHLHQPEIESKVGNDITLIPIGTFDLNKVFNVNTGHKITFKYSIWRSDIIAVKNTKRVEEILGGAPYRKFAKTIEDILDRLDDIKDGNANQDAKLNDIVKRLDNTMSEDQAVGVSNDIISSYGSNQNG